MSIVPPLPTVFNVIVGDDDDDIFEKGSRLKHFLFPCHTILKSIADAPMIHLSRELSVENLEIKFQEVMSSALYQQIPYYPLAPSPIILEE
jgi:hypothetical protein